MPRPTAHDRQIGERFQHAVNAGDRPAADQAWSDLQPVLKRHPSLAHDRDLFLDHALMVSSLAGWMDLTAQMIRGGITGGPYASEVMRRAINANDIAVAEAFFDRPEGLPADLEMYFYDRLEQAIQHDPPIVAPLFLAHAPGDLDPYLVQALTAGSSPLHEEILAAVLPRVDIESEEVSKALLQAAQNGAFNQVALIWPHVPEISEDLRQDLAKAAAAHGQADWLVRFTGDTTARAPWLVEALRHQQVQLACDLWQGLAPAQRIEAWTTLVGTREWAALDTLSSVVPATWRQTLIEWAGPDQAPRAVAHERQLHLQTRPAGHAPTRRRT